MLNAKDWAKEGPLDSGPCPLPEPVKRTVTALVEHRRPWLLRIILGWGA